MSHPSHLQHSLLSVPLAEELDDALVSDGLDLRGESLGSVSLLLPSPSGSRSGAGRASSLSNTVSSPLSNALSALSRAPIPWSRGVARAYHFVLSVFSLCWSAATCWAVQRVLMDGETRRRAPWPCTASENISDALAHTAGRYAKKQFAKGRMPIVERLVNALMMNGRNNGKKIMAVRIVQHAFEIIHLVTEQNPIQVLVDAIVNTGPREDSTRIGSQGTVRRQAVDVSPLRRVNQAISLLTIGTRESAFHNNKSVSECLADELVNAAKGSSNSYAIKKKDELERVAKSNR